MGPDTQDKAVHLTAATGHPFKDVIATCHPSGTGDVAGKIVQHQFAFRKLWKKYGEGISPAFVTQRSCRLQADFRI